MSHENLVNAALGKIPFDTVIENGQLINVYTGEIHPATIGIIDGEIAYLADKHEKLQAKEYINATNQFIMPGMIDSHMHIESSMTTPSAFAQGVLPRGVTAVVADPHEIGNVLGVKGVKMMLDASEKLPLKVYTMIPSTMPSLPGFETAGAETTPKEVKELLAFDDVLGLGEVMDFNGVIDLDENMTNILKTAKEYGVIIEGHDPILREEKLQAFIAAGVDSDHTIADVEKMKSSLRSGVAMQVQLKSVTPELMEYLNQLPDLSNFSLVTDDVTADHLSYRGHLDYVVRYAIQCGLDPIKAVQATTIAPARRMRLFNRGGIGPGRLADIVLLNSLENFEVDTVLVKGQVIVQKGKLQVEIAKSEFPKEAYQTIHLEKVSPEDFSVFTKLQRGTATVNAVVLNGVSSFTVREEVQVPIENGKLKVKDTDLVFMSVIERHGVRGSKFTGVLKNFGKIHGALATTYAHDSHNLVCYGDNEEDMAAAANYLIEIGGGMAIVQDGKVLAEVRLPIAGLLSEKSVDEICKETGNFANQMKTLGVDHKELIMMLTVMPLAVSPEIKITDLGLVDVNNKKFLDFLLSEQE